MKDNQPKFHGVPKFLKGSRNIVSLPYRKMFFGVGNHYYPYSRASVGTLVCDEWAKKYGLTFDEEPELHASVAENERCTLVRPMTYLIENNCRSLLASTHAYQSPLDRVVIIHHEEKMELGHVELTWAGHVPHNTALRGVKDLFGTERFGRLAVGVGHPSYKAIQGRYLPTYHLGEHDYTARFLQNKFPPEELGMLLHVVMPKIFETMDVAMAACETEQYMHSVKISYKEVEEQYRELLKTIPKDERGEAYF